MRVLLDANIFISYLLNPDRKSPIVRIVEAGVRGRYTLLLPATLLDEFSHRIISKPYLEKHISSAQLMQLSNILSSLAEVIPEIRSSIPAVTRDPKDDYLLAYALVGRADFLVSGDQDLLVLERVGGCRILAPRNFGKLLDDERR